MRFLCGVSVPLEIEPHELEALQDNPHIAAAAQWSGCIEMRLYIESPDEGDVVNDASVLVVDTFAELGLPVIDIADLVIQAEPL